MESANRLSAFCLLCHSLNVFHEVARVVQRKRVSGTTPSVKHWGKSSESSPFPPEHSSTAHTQRRAVRFPEGTQHQPPPDSDCTMGASAPGTAGDPAVLGSMHPSRPVPPLLCFGQQYPFLIQLWRRNTELLFILVRI